MNSQISYKAMLDRVITGRNLRPEEREGIAAEINRLQRKKKCPREHKLLDMFRKSLAL